jgi:hypothetical protein
MAVSQEECPPFPGNGRPVRDEGGEDVKRRARNSIREARQRVVPGPVPDTRPSHDLASYVGRYEHPAYGPLSISLENDQLQFVFRKTHLPLNHFHYDRFDSPDDEVEGAWSVLFQTSPLGDIDRAVLWIDQAEAVFRRAPETVPQSVLDKITGTYVTAIGIKAVVRLNREQKLTLRFANGPAEILVPFKDLQFRSYLSPKTTFEFVMDGDRVKALRHWNAIAEFVLTRSEDSGAIDTMEEDEPADD